MSLISELKSALNPFLQDEDERKQRLVWQDGYALFCSVIVTLFLCRFESVTSVLDKSFN